jgi:polyphosphate glucokinase
MAKATPAPAPGPSPHTLAFDIGGTGLKAALVDPDGELVGEPARTPTTYPMPPERLVEALLDLARSLGPAARCSAGFPGMVRRGTVLSAPHFVTKHGPGSETVPELERAWDHFPLAERLAHGLGLEVRVDNDADQQGAAVIRGEGIELVITLGTGLGTALFADGHLAPHLEIAHQPFRKKKTYNDVVGEAARERLGNEKWSRRVGQAIGNLRALTFYDHLFVGGGNARHVRPEDLGPDATVVDNVSGLLGGVRLWQPRPSSPAHASPPAAGSDGGEAPAP